MSELDPTASPRLPFTTRPRRRAASTALGERSLEGRLAEGVTDARGQLGERGALGRPRDDVELAAGLPGRGQDPRGVGVALNPRRHFP